MQNLVAEHEIAILLATYNGGKYLREQLNSILSQTYTKWHLYIHDDGSKDNTIEILKDYQLRYPDKVTIVEGEPTGGAKNNFYFLLKRVDASLYMFSDQDDVWQPNKIETEVNAWEQNKADDIPVLVFTDLKIVNQNLDVVSDSLWMYYKFNTENIRMQSLILQNVVTGCTMLFNRKLREMMIMYKNIDNVPMHDKWGAMIALQFGKMIRIGEQTILYRQHENNAVGAQESKGLSYVKRKLQHINDLKEKYAFTRRQAKEFCESFKLDENKYCTLVEYSKLDDVNKIKRLFYYSKKRFFTNRINQIIGIILAG